MASLGHIAVGMAAARVPLGEGRSRWPAMAWWSALSMLPDADVVGFSLGVRYGGLGCALLWPLDLTRYFAPWRPIPVAPIGLSFFSPYGLFVAATELVLFAPLLMYGLGVSRIRRERRSSLV